MPLKLTLKPGERIAINGAVLVNHDRRTSLLVENRARILRESDILQPSDVNSPAKHIYFPVMMMYLDPDERTGYHADFAARLAEFLDVVTDPGIQEKCLSIAAHVANEAFYKALVDCRALIAYEQEHLNDAA